MGARALWAWGESPHLSRAAPSPSGPHLLGFAQLLFQELRALLADLHGRAAQAGHVQRGGCRALLAPGLVRPRGLYPASRGLPVAFARAHTLPGDRDSFKRWWVALVRVGLAARQTADIGWGPEAWRAEPRDRPWATHLPLWASVSICKIEVLPVRPSPGCHEGRMTKHKGSWGQGQDSVIFVHHLLQPGAQGCTWHTSGSQHTSGAQLRLSDR